ncbi:MAG TPA: hypothetical protein VNF99_04125 [Stellaceae bacterium]|nr:hypothetical protein [Stellaceae bacterium]
MRNLASALMIVVGAGILSLPTVRAQDESDRPVTPQTQPQQHQEATPSPGDTTTRRDQAAQAPLSSPVVRPPATGDRNVIVPPATGDAKTPVIPPPGTPGSNGNVHPN